MKNEWVNGAGTHIWIPFWKQVCVFYWMQWSAGVACGRGLEFGWCFVTGMSYGEGILRGVCMEAARRSCRGCQAFVQTEEEVEERK